jgi:hypothetical protein
MLREWQWFCFVVLCLFFLCCVLLCFVFCWFVVFLHGVLDLSLHDGLGVLEPINSLGDEIDFLWGDHRAQHLQLRQDRIREIALVLLAENRVEQHVQRPSTVVGLIMCDQSLKRNYTKVLRNSGHHFRKFPGGLGAQPEGSRT